MIFKLKLYYILDHGVGKRLWDGFDFVLSCATVSLVFYTTTMLYFYVLREKVSQFTIIISFTKIASRKGVFFPEM